MAPLRRYQPPNKLKTISMIWRGGKGADAHCLIGALLTRLKAPYAWAWRRPSCALTSHARHALSQDDVFVTKKGCFQKGADGYRQSSGNRLVEKLDGKPPRIESNDLALAFHLAFIMCKGSRDHDLLSDKKLRFALDVCSTGAAVYNPSFEKSAVGRKMRFFRALRSRISAYLFILGTTKASFPLGFFLLHRHISRRFKWFPGRGNHPYHIIAEVLSCRCFLKTSCQMTGFQKRWILRRKERETGGKNVNRNED